MAQSAIVDAPDSEPEPQYGRPMSIEEWEQMDEDEPGELVDGKLEEEEVPDFPHEIVLQALIRVLMAWTHDGLVFASEAKYALSKRRGRKPDISVFLTRDRKLPRRGAARIPPDIMIEIVSPRPRDHRRDRVQKLREYAAFGVPWYWIVDPAARTIEILRLGADGRYGHALDADDGTVEVPGCEGLTLDLDALWRQLDELVADEDDPPEV